jgi:hypothetical protein
MIPERIFFFEPGEALSTNLPRPKGGFFKRP